MDNPELLKALLREYGLSENEAIDNEAWCKQRPIYSRIAKGLPAGTEEEMAAESAELRKQIASMVQQTHSAGLPVSQVLEAIKSLPFEGKLS